MKRCKVDRILWHPTPTPFVEERRSQIADCVPQT